MRIRRGLRSDLIPDELVLWRGKPVLDEYMSRYCLVSCLGVLFWGVFLLGCLGTTSAWGVFAGAPALPTLDVIEEAGPPGMALAVVTVVCLFAAVYLSFGHYAISYLAWRRTEYVITEHRVMIYDGLLWRTLHSLPLLQISSVQVHDRGKGRGDVIIELSSRVIISASVPGVDSHRSHPAAYTLYALDSTQEAQAALRMAAERALRTTSTR